MEFEPILENCTVKVEELAEFNSRNISKDYEYDKIEYIDTSSVLDGYLFHTQLLEKNKSPSRAKRLIQKNDILISTVRPNLKHYMFVKSPSANSVVSTGFLVITPRKIVPRFLYYVLTEPNFTEFLIGIAFSHTSAYPAFPPEIIKTHEINLPSKKMQEFVSNTLGNLDDQIEILRNMNQNLEKTIRSVFKSWFVNFDGQTEFVDSELGQIPKGWKVSTIKELANITSGNRPDALSKNKDSEFNIPLYGASGIMGYVKDFIYDDGILLTGRVGTIGKIQYVDEKCFPSDNTLVILPNNKDYFNFIYEILLNINFELIVGGSTQPLITQTDLKNINLICPEDSIIKKFDKMIIPIRKKIQKNSFQIINLTKTRDVLLPKLMSGEIRV